MALEMDHSSADAYHDRGVAHGKGGDIGRAIEEYTKSLEVKPNKAAYANRGFCWLHLSEWEKARSDLLSSRNMGMDLVAAFRAGHGSVADFEQKNRVELPADLAELVSVKEPKPEYWAGQSVLELFRRLRESAPPGALDDLPADGARNYKHYLYGSPKE